MAGETGIEGSRDHQFQAKRAGDLAERQYGPIARRQLLEIGFSPTRIRDWLRCGRLHPRYPGVYAFGRPSLGTEGQLAAGVLYAGQGSALGSLTALWWLELLHRRPRHTHLDAPGHRSSREDLLIRHPGRTERRWHRGLPLVPLPHALLAAAGLLAHNSLRLVLARAEFKGQLHLPSLQAAISEGRRGSRAVRAAMDAYLPQLAACANDFERSFVLLCESHSLPLPEPNATVGRYRPDMLWREARLIVELDGEDAHHTPAQLTADATKQATLEALGFTVIRFSWAEVTYESGLVVDRVRSALARR